MATTPGTATTRGVATASGRISPPAPLPSPSPLATSVRRRRARDLPAWPAAAPFWRDYLTLTKPGITTFIALTAAAGYLLAAGGAWAASELALLLLATTLASGGAATLNQVLERRADAHMRRTRSRPVAAGRVGVLAAGIWGLSLCAAGIGVSAVTLTPLTTALLAASAVVYVLIYTPAKRAHPTSTYAGAVPGALPILAGWTATGRPAGMVGWTLFAILFLWQLPHFLAIARLCRDDYRRAGFRVLGVTDADGLSAGRHALAYALALVIVGPAPALFGVLGWVYALAALALGIGYAWLALRLVWQDGTDTAARRLFLASLAYLPLLLLAMAADRIILVSG